MEESMVNFLNSGKYATTDDEALKTTWYNFDNVNFVIGKADQLEAGSEGQIQNIATILKAFLMLKLKLADIRIKQEMKLTTLNYLRTEPIILKLN